MFYDATASERLSHFSLDNYSVVTFQDTSAHGRATGRRIGQIRYSCPLPRPKEPEIGGLTYVLRQRSRRYTAIFMRRSIGITDETPEVESMLKLVILLHELGHVDDFERGINYSQREIDLHGAEVYAHHFACRALIRHKYRIALGWYLHQLEVMAANDAPAARVTKSREFMKYQGEVSRFYQRDHTV